MKNNQFIRICLEILVGIIVSMSLSALLIFVGYYKVNSAGLSSYDVSIAGVTLYKIIKVNSEYTGQAINQSMSIVGAVCCVLCIVVNEFRILLKNKKGK